MGKTLVTFLGTGDYKKAKYVFVGGKSVESVYFPVALTEQEEIEEIIVFLTKEAKAKHHIGFLSELSAIGQANLIVNPIEIPLGTNEEELWIIFEKMVAAIGNNKSILVDITHGLRHFQILTILCLSYLYFSSGLEIPGVYYGAYEVGNAGKLGSPSNSKNIIRVAPVFELSPFISLLSWMDGVNSFNRYGDASIIGTILKQIHDEQAKNHENYTTMQKLGSNLAGLSQALMVSRPDDVEKILNGFSSFVSTAKEEIKDDIGKWAKPFGLVLDNIIEEYFEILKPEDELERRLSLVDWYLRRNYIPQAMTLLRETMVSKRIYAVEDNLDNENNLSVREQAQAWLNKNADKHTEIGTQWGYLRDLRNDISHCGYRNQAYKAEILIKNSKDCFERIKGIWELDDLWAK